MSEPWISSKYKSLANQLLNDIATSETAIIGKNDIDLLTCCIKQKYKKYDLNTVAKQSINHLKKKKIDINENNFSQEFKSQIKKIHISGISKFGCMFQISLNLQQKKSISLKLDNKQLTIYKKAPIKYLEATLKKDKSTYAIITGESYSSRFFSNESYNLLNIFRAVLHLISPLGWEIVSEEGYFKAINKVTIDDSYSVHDYNGNKIESYNIFFNSTNRHVLDISDQHVKSLKKVFRYLSGLHNSYYKIIYNSLLLYTQSLDSIGQSSSLLSMWSAIEKLSKGNQSKYDDLITRCSYLYNNQEYVKRRMLLIKDSRNSFVHDGFEDLTLHQAQVYELMKVYRTLFSFHLTRNKIFSKVDDAYFTMDLLKETTELDKKISLIKSAKKHLK